MDAEAANLSFAKTSSDSLGTIRIPPAKAVQGADFGKLHDVPRRRELDRPEVFGNLHALHSVAKLRAKHLVAVAEEKGRCGVVREGVDDLLGGPGSSRVLGDVEVDHPPAVVGEDDKEGSGRLICARVDARLHPGIRSGPDCLDSVLPYEEVYTVRRLHPAGAFVQGGGGSHASAAGRRPNSARAE